MVSVCKDLIDKSGKVLVNAEHAGAIVNSAQTIILKCD